MWLLRPDHGGIRTWSVAHRAPRPRLRRCPRLRRVDRPARCIAACVGPDHTGHPQLPRYRCTYVRDGAQGSLALRSAPLGRVSLQFSPSVGAKCGLAAALQSSPQAVSIPSKFLIQNRSVTQHPAGLRRENFCGGRQDCDGVHTCAPRARHVRPEGCLLLHLMPMPEQRVTSP